MRAYISRVLACLRTLTSTFRPSECLEEGTFVCADDGHQQKQGCGGSDGHDDADAVLALSESFFSLSLALGGTLLLMLTRSVVGVGGGSASAAAPRNAISCLAALIVVLHALVLIMMLERSGAHRDPDDADDGASCVFGAGSGCGVPPFLFLSMAVYSALAVSAQWQWRKDVADGEEEGEEEEEEELAELERERRAAPNGRRLVASTETEGAARVGGEIMSPRRLNSSDEKVISGDIGGSYNSLNKSQHPQYVAFEPSGLPPLDHLPWKHRLPNAVPTRPLIGGAISKNIPPTANGGSVAILTSTKYTMTDDYRLEVESAIEVNQVDPQYPTPDVSPVSDCTEIQSDVANIIIESEDQSEANIVSRDGRNNGGQTTNGDRALQSKIAALVQYFDKGSFAIASFDSGTICDDYARKDGGDATPESRGGDENSVLEDEWMGRHKEAAEEQTAARRSHDTKVTKAFDHFHEPCSVREDASWRRTNVRQASLRPSLAATIASSEDEDPGVATYLSEISTSEFGMNDDDCRSPDDGGECSSASSPVDDVPLSDVRFKSMARQASTMTINDIEMEEVAAWVSLIDVMDQQSSEEDDESDDGYAGTARMKVNFSGVDEQDSTSSEDQDSSAAAAKLVSKEDGHRGPDEGSESSGDSLSVDDVPSLDVGFKRMAGRASATMIGDVKTKETAARVSVIDVIHQRSSEEEKESDDDAHADALEGNIPCEDEQNAASSNNQDEEAAVFISKSSTDNHPDLDFSGESSSASSSVDDIPLSDAGYKSMARRASAMTMDDIEIEEAAALVSVIDVMDQQSSDDEDESDDDAGAARTDANFSREDEQTDTRSENTDPGVSFYISELSTPELVRNGDHGDHRHGPDDGGESSASSSVDDLPSPSARFKSMAMRASAMTMDDVKMEDVAARFSVIDVVDQQSSDGDDESDVSTQSAATEKNPPREDEQNTASLENENANVAACISESSTSGLTPNDDDHYGLDDDGESSNASSSVDDIPSPEGRFKSMARRASAMTIGDVEIEEVAAWVSVLDIMDHQSSDEEDESDDDASAATMEKNEDGQNK